MFVPETHMPIIESCALFQGISKPELRFILNAAEAREQKITEGETVRMRANSTLVAIVLEGSLLLEAEDTLGNRLLLSSFTRGECICRSETYEPSEELVFLVRGREPCMLLLLDREKLLFPREDARCNQRLIHNFIDMLVGRQSHFMNTLAILTMRTTRKKILAFLQLQSAEQGGAKHIRIGMSRQEQADFLAVDRSALSKELSHMQTDGLIRYHLNDFWLLQNEL
jgi:CRP-like cAMP-binding protein